MIIVILGPFTTRPTLLDALNVFKLATIISSQTVCLLKERPPNGPVTNHNQSLLFFKPDVSKSQSLARLSQQTEIYFRQKMSILPRQHQSLP